MKTIFVWTLNGPLDQKGNFRCTVNFIKADEELSQQLKRFWNQELSDSAYDKNAGLSKGDLHAISIMQQSFKLKS